jgi:hypothetical protein
MKQRERRRRGRRGRDKGKYASTLRVINLEMSMVAFWWHEITGLLF